MRHADRTHYLLDGMTIALAILVQPLALRIGASYAPAIQGSGRSY